MADKSPEQVISQVVTQAVKNGMSKKDIAKKMKTSVAIVTRIEHCHLDATIPLLQCLADALNMRLSIRFLPQ